MPQLSAGSAKPPRQHVYTEIVYNIGSPHSPPQPPAASPGRARMRGSGSLQHYFKLSRQPKWHNIFVKCLPFHWFSIYIKQFAQEIKQRTIFSLFQFNLQPASLSLTLHFIEKRIMETKRRIIDIHLTFKLKTWNVFWKETQKFHSDSSRSGIYKKVYINYIFIPPRRGECRGPICAEPGPVAHQPGRKFNQNLQCQHFYWVVSAKCGGKRVKWGVAPWPLALVTDAQSAIIVYLWRWSDGLPGPAPLPVLVMCHPECRERGAAFCKQS